MTPRNHQSLHYKPFPKSNLSKSTTYKSKPSENRQFPLRVREVGLFQGQEAVLKRRHRRTQPQGSRFPCLILWSSLLQSIRSRSLSQTRQPSRTPSNPQILLTRRFMLMCRTAAQPYRKNTRAPTKANESPAVQRAFCQGRNRSLGFEPLSVFVEQGGEEAFAISGDFELCVSCGGVGIAGAFLEEV
jgi:hypothetical protein